MDYYEIVNIMFDKLILTIVVLQVVYAECQAQASGTGKCFTDRCDVTIDGETYCSQCAEKATEAPIDGVCKAVASDPSGCQSDNAGGCTQCGAGYFLHKGGCYQIGKAPGNLVCADSIPGPSARTAGICATCKDGYYKNPGDRKSVV